MWQTIAVPFTIGDNLYITFAPTKIIYATVSSFCMKEYTIKYIFNYTNGRGGTYIMFYKDGSVVDLYSDKDLAIKACIDWSQRNGNKITEHDIIIEDQVR